MPATISHALSATTPDDPSYEIRPTHWNSAHAITLNASGSEISGAFGNGGGITFGLSADGKVTAAAPAGAPSPINFSAGTTSGNIGSVVFSDSNGLAFGLNGSTITGSYTQSTHAHSQYSFSNLNGVTFGTNGSTVTASVQTNYAGVGESVGTVAGTDLALTVNTDGVSILYPKWLSTARGSTDAIGLNTAQTNVTWTVNSSGLSLNAGGYAGTGFTSTTTAGTQVKATQGTDGLSMAVPAFLTTSVAQTNQSAIKAFGVSNTGATAGNTGVSTGIDWVLAGSNLLTLSQSTAGGGPNTVWIQHPAWLTTARASTDAIGLNTAQTNVTWTVNSSGLSLNAGGYAGTGTSATNASITMNTNGLAISVAAPPAGIALYDGANSISSGTARFTNANGVSFTFNGQTVSGSISAIRAFGASNTGNTAGNTGVSTGVDWVIAGSSPVTISQSTAAGSNTVWIQAPATSSLVGINGISISTAGNTISVLPQWISSYENFDNCGSNTMTLNAASISHAVAFYVPQPISGSFIRIPVLMTTNSTTIATMASATASASGELYSTWNAVVYSMGVGGNSKSMQSVASGSGGFTFRNSISITNSTQYSVTQGFSAQAQGAGTTRTTQYSISNTNYSFSTNSIATEWSSGRFLDIPFASSLTPGAYWLVFGYSSSTASAGAAGLAALTNCNVRYSNHYAVSQVDIAFGIMGSTNLTSGGLVGCGSFSTAGGGTTNSIPISAISSSASQVRPYFQILRSA